MKNSKPSVLLVVSRIVIINLMLWHLTSCERESAFDQGCNAYNRKDYDRAIACFNYAIRLDPGVPQFYLHRGASYDEKGEREKAVADYNEVLRLDPNVPAAYRLRGGVHYSRGDYEKAKSDYDEAIRLYSDFPEANNDLAWLLATCPKAEFRDGRKAVEYAKKSYEHWIEKPAFTMDTLAAAYAELAQVPQFGTCRKILS